MPDAFDAIYGQPRVRAYLRSCVAQRCVSHAYLFTGVAGSNKETAAFAFAEEILKAHEDDPSMREDIRRRVSRRMHPDIHHLSPEGAQGYLVDQVRSVVADVTLAPMQGARKIYIVDEVDRMGTSAANAFLKTLEEPPDDVVIILLGRTASSILPTIVSRCQVVPFRTIPANEAASILVQNVGCSDAEAKIAIQTCGGSVTKAAAFLRSSERGLFRQKVLTVLASLARADDLDVLDYAADLVTSSKAPLDEVQRDHARILEESAEYLQKSALKELAATQKRALGRATTELLAQMTSIIRSWLRDVMVTCAGTPELVVNADARDAVADAASRTSVQKACRALARASSADEAISYNVSPQLSIEALLFEIREVLYA
ncbi:DNA polymerase III subunit delta [Slackia exigua]|uniref:DNA polymerase III subunit n=1 Tax=Slackia exigua TaxID=84109 RepID=UPI0028D0A54B|nr:DNA polymerase III subunit delta [Slackia exigua]